MGNSTSAPKLSPGPAPTGAESHNQPSTGRGTDAGNLTDASSRSGGQTSSSGQSVREDSACPVPAAYRNPAVYNVYGQQVNAPDAAPAPKNPLAALRSSDLLDPSNNMPLEANQQPCAGQRKPLPVERVASNIPKGGTDTTWTYPSPQMVFNALRRKGKGDDVTEDDMEGFVHAHNAMNESTWRQVQLWERLHAECQDARLLRFRGRPDDLSPQAWIRHKLGGPLPFDRHDWTVDRCGQEVRYIIDFYFYDEKAGTPGAFEIQTRPALDSFEAALDRLKMSIYLKFADWGLPCPITGHTPSIAADSTAGAVAADSR